MNDETQCRVLIADDHEVYRLGLRLIVESLPGFAVCAEAERGDEVLRLAGETRPQMMILDYAMPGMTGLDVLYELRRRHLDLNVLVLTAIEVEGVLAETIAAGAGGLCLKQESNEELTRAIKTVATGESYIAPAIAPLTARAEALAGLTPRERQVLIHVVRGRRNREIAELLNVSPKTIDVHRTNLMKKLDLHSVAELVDFANRSGLSDV